MSSIHRFFQKLLGSLSAVVFHHPQEILLVSILLTGLSGYVAFTRFKVVNNISQLLDENSAANRHYLALQKEFGTDEQYLILIQSDDPERNREVALEFLRAKLYQLKVREQEREAARVKGETVSIEWGNQIRSYVLHPYQLVKDHRTGHETGNIDAVLDGDLDGFIQAELKQGKEVGEISK